MSSYEHVTLSHLHLTHKGPDIHVESAVRNAWKNGQLTNAEALLTRAISMSIDTAHILASQALVHTCL